VANWTAVGVDAGHCCICSLGLHGQDIHYSLMKDDHSPHASEPHLMQKQLPQDMTFK
jgi:hypothetical protein